MWVYQRVPCILSWSDMFSQLGIEEITLVADIFQRSRVANPVWVTKELQAFWSEWSYPMGNVASLSSRFVTVFFLAFSFVLSLLLPSSSFSFVVFSFSCVFRVVLSLCFFFVSLPSFCFLPSPVFCTIQPRRNVTFYNFPTTASGLGSNAQTVATGCWQIGHAVVPHE